MFKRSSLRLGAVLSGALVIGGCANQLSQRSEHEARVERKLVEHSLQVDVGEPATLELPQRRIHVQELKTFDVTEFDVSRRYDRYTPYQPWREIYEIPLGAVVMVAGIGANIVNVFTLGNLPDNITHGWISYGIDGLNPFMNVSSHGRAQQNLAGIEEVQKDHRVEHSKLPWNEGPVWVSAGAQTHELTTDRNGILRLNLLDSPFAEQDLTRVMRLQFRVTDEQRTVTSTATLPLSHGLRGKLVEAHDLIYGDLEEEDVNQWVNRVKRLSELGLEEQASELEQNLIDLTRNDPQLQKEFVRALARNAGRLVAVPATLD